MMLSDNTASVLVDLVENKLAVMQIGDRHDLREVLTLQRCLSELKGMDAVRAGTLANLTEADVPRRGRGRKVSSIMGSN